MLNGLIGGIFIGLSAVLLMALLGRIAGISGILTGMFSGGTMERLGRFLFVIGLILAPVLLGLAKFHVDFEVRQSPIWLVLAAGFLVGLGTRIGNGCTSGHGVCGLARLSPRSAAAVATFLITAMVTVYVVRHILEIATS